MSKVENIVAIVLAAGQSKRMGAAKLLLPWGDTTVLGQVIRTCALETSNILVVTGGWRAEVEAEVTRLAEKYPVRTVYNNEHERGEMLSSIQVGLQAASDSARAAFVVLGDQPQVQSRTVWDVLRAFDKDEGHIIVPSYRMRRGHPILIPRQYWDEILQMRPPQTLRDFLNAHANNITYVEANETVLQDLDTPEDYKRAQGA